MSVTRRRFKSEKLRLYSRTLSGKFKRGFNKKKMSDISEANSSEAGDIVCSICGREFTGESAKASLHRHYKQVHHLQVKRIYLAEDGAAACASTQDRACSPIVMPTEEAEAPVLASSSEEAKEESKEGVNSWCGDPFWGEELGFHSELELLCPSPEAEKETSSAPLGSLCHRDSAPGRAAALLEAIVEWTEGMSVVTSEEDFVNLMREKLTDCPDWAFRAAYRGSFVGRQRLEEGGLYFPAVGDTERSFDPAEIIEID